MTSIFRNSCARIGLRTRRTIAVAALLSTAAIGGDVLAAADLHWDLTYQAALNAYPIDENEFMQYWIKDYPERPIHEKLAAYAGETIEASLLIEGPDGHAGEPQGRWFIKTRSSVQACWFHAKSSSPPCQTLDPARFDVFIREVMNFKPLEIQPAQQVETGKAPEDKPLLINYIAFLSIYLDGKTLQRPIALAELIESGDMPGVKAGADGARIERAITRVMLSDEELQKQQRGNEAPPSSECKAAPRI
ncbi:MAG: hypothetical protein V4724_11830 [Pseudomonadota bacterium]